jgi:hypothetical protein
MRRAHTFAAAIATLVLMGAASAVHAESPRITLTGGGGNLAGPAPTVGEAQWGPQATHRSFQWNQRGRWSLRLDMSQPVGRDMQLRDVQAGAYYHLTPSLRVGGAVSLGDTPSQPDHTPLPQTQAPRVKLETSFKF